MLDVPETGLAGAATARIARDYAAFTWSGTLLLVLLAALAALVIPAAWTNGLAAYARESLLRPRPAVFAGVAAAASALLAWAINELVLGGQPNLIDAASQLVHARYLAAGHLAGPRSALSAFWYIPQTVLTPNGWVSQYPPGQVLLLALGLRLGMVSLVGPLLLAGTVYLTARLADRLLPEDPVAARTGVLLLALSPFALAHAAAYLSHTSAALFSVIALHAATGLRQQRGGRGSAVALGAALGILFATRPLTAVIVGVLALVWLLSARVRPPVRLLWAASLTVVPVLLGLGWYNQHFFGSPFRFGYGAAMGPHAGLGWGIDPWGNEYGFRAAIGYTSAELTALNAALLETPLPVVVMAALFLVGAAALAPGQRLLAGWALLPVAVHLGYWHHGLFMGPRMLNEYAPAWCLLTAVAALALVRRSSMRATTAGTRFSPRVFAHAALLGACMTAIGWTGPQRLLGYRAAAPSGRAIARVARDSALVFVHGPWSTRVSMRLAVTGLRVDSLELLLRNNSTCVLQRWLDASPAGKRPALRWASAAGDTLLRVEIAPGSRIRWRRGEGWPAECQRQAAADTAGVHEVAGLLWRGSLPGADDGRASFVRDLGPEANAMLIAASGLRPVFLERAPSGRALQTVAYPGRLAALWGLQTPVPASGRQSR